MKDFHTVSWDEKIKIKNAFKDKRLTYFANLMLYEEKPETLDKQTIKEINDQIANRLLSKNKEKWQTVNMAYTEIDYLRDQASNRDDEEELKKLDEINEFIMSIEKKYEIA